MRSKQISEQMDRGLTGRSTGVGRLASVILRPLCHHETRVHGITESFKPLRARLLTHNCLLPTRRRATKQGSHRPAIMVPPRPIARRSNEEMKVLASRGAVVLYKGELVKQNQHRMSPRELSSHPTMTILNVVTNSNNIKL